MTTTEIQGEFDGDTSSEALAAWERYSALPENPGTEGYPPKMCEEDAFTAGYDAARKWLAVVWDDGYREGHDDLEWDEYGASPLNPERTRRDTPTANPFRKEN